MLKMIGESRWTGTTLKFGLNIEQSSGHSVAEGQPRLLGRRPPTLSSTLPTRRPKLFDGTSLIWIWRSCEHIKSLFAPRSISSKVIPLGLWDLWGIYWRESGRLLKSLKLRFSQTFLIEVHNTPSLSVADSLKRSMTFSLKIMIKMFCSCHSSNIVKISHCTVLAHFYTFEN